MRESECNTGTTHKYGRGAQDRGKAVGEQSLVWRHTKRTRMNAIEIREDASWYRPSRRDIHYGVRYGYCARGPVGGWRSARQGSGSARRSICTQGQHTNSAGERGCGGRPSSARGGIVSPLGRRSGMRRKRGGGSWSARFTDHAGDRERRAGESHSGLEMAASGFRKASRLSPAPATALTRARRRGARARAASVNSRMFGMGIAGRRSAPP